MLENTFGNPGEIRDHTWETRDHTCYDKVPGSVHRNETKRNETKRNDATSGSFDQSHARGEDSRNRCEIPSDVELICRPKLSDLASFQFVSFRFVSFRCTLSYHTPERIPPSISETRSSIFRRKIDDLDIPKSQFDGVRCQ